MTTFSKKHSLILSLLFVSHFTFEAFASAPKPQDEPYPGTHCEASIQINNEWWLYRTSFVKEAELSLQPATELEVDILQNSQYAAQSMTRYVGSGRFEGVTGTGTPISVYINFVNKRVTFHHAGRTISGYCDRE
jgi:hypothetical protein